VLIGNNSFDGSCHNTQWILFFILLKKLD